MRTLELGVTAMAAGAEFDDTLDDISAEVETAIGADPTLGGLVLDCVLTRTESTSIPTETKPPERPPRLPADLPHQDQRTAVRGLTEASR